MTEFADLEALAPHLYAELHRLASAYMRRERADHTLQPTALINEAWIRLSASPGPEWTSRAHFLSIAAQCMRQILVDHARRRNSEKRGAGQVLVPLGTLDRSAEETAPEELLALDEALRRLGELDARKARVIELRFFGGLTVPEIAQVIGVHERTIANDLRIARAWLRSLLEQPGDGA